MGILGKWSYPMDYLCQCLYGLFGQWSNLWIISLCLTTRIMGQCATTRASTPPSARITDQCPTTRIMGQRVTTSFLTNIRKNYRPMSYHKDHEPTCYYTTSIQCPQLFQTNVLFPYNVHNYYRPKSYHKEHEHHGPTSLSWQPQSMIQPWGFMSQNTHHKVDGITALSWKL